MAAQDLPEGLVFKEQPFSGILLMFLP